MNINPDKVTMQWQREGLSVKQSGREIAVVDITTLSLLKIGYGDNLDIMPAGSFMTSRQKIVKLLKIGYTDNLDIMQTGWFITENEEAK